jgi:FHS family L-fucose permease-like MFS transporter
MQARYAGGNTPLAIITMLFFMWGLLTSLNDVLIPHLKAVYTLSYVQAMLVQFCFFGAYFLVSLPAGRLVRRLGYQGGVVAGLSIAAFGCALFYPAATGGYTLFLLALFVMAAGITVLQVAANPYVTALGAPDTAPSRLTLTQAFNSLGTTIAPALGGMLILSSVPGTPETATASPAHAVQLPYLGLATALAVLAMLFAVIKLPRLGQDTRERTAGPSLWRHDPLALIGVGLCNSIMFPTIFSMALHGLGPRSGEGSGLLCMAIVGGAIVPFLQGMLADLTGIHLSFLVPLACYAFILFYGIRCRRLLQEA